MRSSGLAIRLAAGGTLVTALAFARDAQSFCRTFTHQPPAGWDLVAQGCFVDSGAKALFWNNSCVGYSLHANASRRVTLEQATSIVAAAFEAWTSVACAAGGSPSVHAVDLGPVECGKVQYNRDQPNQNVILFHDDEWPYGASESTLGLTTVTFDTTTGELLGADIELNATQNLVVGDAVPAGGYNLASVITHEVGHFLGLAHSAESTAIMFAKYTPAAQLASDDVQGLCSIYAPDGTRVTTDGTWAAGACDPTPHGGFVSACSAPPGTSMPGSDPAEPSGGCSMAPRLPSHGSREALVGTLSLAWLGLRRRRAACR